MTSRPNHTDGFILREKIKRRERRVTRVRDGGRKTKRTEMGD